MPQTDIKSIRERLADFKQAMTAKEVATLFNVSEETVHSQARRGEIPSFYVGTSRRFDPRYLAEWLDKMTIR